MISKNMMHDRRIVRGNTHSIQVLPTTQLPEVILKKNPKARKPRVEEDERMHMEIQTDLYLEELVDAVPEQSAMTQTDEFLDRPRTPMYVPAKLGTDKGTEIKQGDLFDFAKESESIVQVLCSRVLEQSTLELQESREQSKLRRKQRDIEARRHTEQSEVQRLEKKETRLVEEKIRRKQESLRSVSEFQETAKKLAATSFTEFYLVNLKQSTIEYIKQKQNHEASPPEVNQYIQSIHQFVDLELHKQKVAQNIVDMMIK